MAGRGDAFATERMRVTIADATRMGMPDLFVIANDGDRIWGHKLWQVSGLSVEALVQLAAALYYGQHREECNEVTAATSSMAGWLDLCESAAREMLGEGR